MLPISGKFKSGFTHPPDFMKIVKETPNNAMNMGCCLRKYYKISENMKNVDQRETGRETAKREKE